MLSIRVYRYTVIILFGYLSRLWRRCWVHWSTDGRGPWGWRWGFGCTSVAANCTFHLTWSYTQMSGRYPGCLSPWQHSPQPRQTPRTSPRLSLSDSQSPRRTGEARRALEVHQEQVRNQVLTFTEFYTEIIILITNKNSDIWSLPVVIICWGLSLPTHPFLDGVMLMLYFVPHSSMLRSQPLSVPLQLCWRPMVSTASTVYMTPGMLSFQVTDTTPVVQLTVGR